MSVRRFRRGGRERIPRQAIEHAPDGFPGRSFFVEETQHAALHGGHGKPPSLDSGSSAMKSNSPCSARSKP